MQLTLREDIKTYEKSSKGVPFKNGDLNAIIQATDGRKYSGFLRPGHPILAARAGDTVEVDVQEKNGFFNFYPPRVQGPLSQGGMSVQQNRDEVVERLESIEGKVDALRPMLDEIIGRLTGDATKIPF